MIGERNLIGHMYWWPAQQSRSDITYLTSCLSYLYMEHERVVLNSIISLGGGFMFIHDGGST